MLQMQQFQQRQQQQANNVTPTQQAPPAQNNQLQTLQLLNLIQQHQVTQSQQQPQKPPQGDLNQQNALLLNQLLQIMLQQQQQQQMQTNQTQMLAPLFANMAAQFNTQSQNFQKKAVSPPPTPQSQQVPKKRKNIKSAFLFFMLEQQGDIRKAMTKTNEKGESVGPNQIEVTKIIQERWKAMSEEQKEPYRQKSSEDRAKRQEEDKKTPILKAERGKRGCSSFMMFVMVKRPEMIAQDPNLKQDQITSKCGQMWREMNDAQKQYFKELSEKHNLEKKGIVRRPSVKPAPPQPIVQMHQQQLPVQSHVKQAATHDMLQDRILGIGGCNIDDQLQSLNLNGSWEQSTASQN
ncbi:hypothetical protein FGO68_gene4241 [Halteria grandinella]|uniref:HMG box domain-containing protein n=1 Tax=Halteria grandinella TaxID=5974 RepID=A0A8J8T5Y9_HALGN|nr:hypothetical protein FGO68_gene4241 [Halteria grandinella]